MDIRLGKTNRQSERNLLTSLTTFGRWLDDFRRKDPYTAVT